MIWVNQKLKDNPKLSLQVKLVVEEHFPVKPEFYCAFRIHAYL